MVQLLRAHSPLLLLTIIALATLLQGCCCGDDEDKYDCWASTDLGNGVAGSRSTNADRATAEGWARDGVCIAYCEQRDPNVDRAHKKWKKTAKGKKAKTRKSFDVDFQPDIKPIYQQCRKKCDKNKDSNNIKFTEQCSFPASGKSCTAKINYKKKKITAKDDGELSALMEACGTYCEKHDKPTKKAIKKASKESESGSVGRNKKLLDEYQVCRQDCVHEMVKKPKKQEVSCQ